MPAVGRALELEDDQVPLRVDTEKIDTAPGVSQGFAKVVGGV
jgi:hypothetical protein